MKRKLFVFVTTIFTVLLLMLSVSCTTPGILEGITVPQVTVSGQSRLYIGEAFTAKAEITPKDKYSQDVVWTSTNEDIVKVDNNGNVEGVSIGTASIIATSAENQELSGKLYVKVIRNDIAYTDEAPTDITISGNKIGYTGTLGYYRFETTPSNASHDVVWRTSNEEVATVDRMGIVTFEKAGEVIITVYSSKDETVTSSINVKVEESTREENTELAIKKVIAETKDSIIGVASYAYNTNKVLVKNTLGSGYVYSVKGITSSGLYTDDLNDPTIENYQYNIITNKHIVLGSDVLKVYLHTIDEEIPASLIYYDDKVDLSIVTFQYDEYIKPLEFANSEKIEHGEIVIAIGNPEGFDFSSSATAGIVSYPLRYISDDTDNDGTNDWDAAYIQHDASINPGNSGGPLLNLYGQVLGINTMKFSSVDIDNMGFSIPSKTIIELLPYLEKETCPKRAQIGITVISIGDLLASDYEASTEYKYKIPEGVKAGLYITSVTEDSVSDGKLKPDDIMIEFNGLSLRKSIQLRAELEAIVVGSNTEIIVKVIRNGEELTITLVF